MTQTSDSNRETREERNERHDQIARDSLERAEEALAKAIDALQEAHAKGSATESLLLLPTIRAAVDARGTTRAIAAARREDAEQRRTR